MEPDPCRDPLHVDAVRRVANLALWCVLPDPPCNPTQEDRDDQL